MTPALPKPREGQPCNGCGLCCIVVPCVFGRGVLGAVEGPCPALEREDGRYWCGLLRNAHKHVPGLEQKPWASPVIRTLMMKSGGWTGVCDSEDMEA